MESRQEISAGQAAAGMDRGIQALDELRALHLAEELRLEIAKGNVYAREHDRLLRKYGKDHPRTADSAARKRANEAYRTALASEYRFASIPRPAPGKGWTLDGFVRTADGKPVPEATVAVYDRTGGWHREFGYACTDTDGYFALAVKVLPEKTAGPMFARASKGKRILPSEDRQVAPQSGAADRVEIILAEGNGHKDDCLPPDGRMPPTRTPPEPAAPVQAPEVKTGGAAPTGNRVSEGKAASQPKAPDKPAGAPDATGKPASQTRQPVKPGAQPGKKDPGGKNR